jgi:hypothetical protein
MTPESVHDELMEFKLEFRKEFGDFKADLIKTIWLTQLTMIGVTLVGVGLLIHFVK